VILVLALLIGAVAGLRSMTAPAAVAWAANRGALDLGGTPLSFLASPVAVAAFTLFALGELAFDKHPAAPNRIAFAGLTGRIVLGGLCGAALASSAERSLALGAVLGAAGGITGAFAGFHARTRLARATGKPLLVAVAEDALAIGGALAVVALA